MANIPSPYRVDFFQEMGKLCELTVLYELRKASDRDILWQKTLEEQSYQEVYLKPVVRQASSAWCPTVIKYLSDVRYDVIVVGGYSTLTGIEAIKYLKRHNRKYFINCDGGMISGCEHKLKKMLKTFLIGGATGYLSTGKISDEYLQYYGAQKAKIYRYPFTSICEKDLLHKPVDDLEKKEIKRQLGISEAKIVISVGSFITRKGFDILLKAAGLMNREYGFYLIGGAETEEYCKIRKELKLTNVHYVSFISGEKLQKYYHAADLFVLPTREDIWGLVINEAMAAALPVITTDKCVAGMEMLERESIIPSNDENILAEEIMGLLENEAERKRRGARNLDKCREYTIENMARVHMQIFSLLQ